MATTIVPDTCKRRVLKALVPSENCILMPAGNAHTFPNGLTIREDEEMVFDLDGVPEHGDLVLMHSDGRTPFVRCCEIAPATGAQRDQWCMGVLGVDGEEVVFINLGKFDRVGVFRGVATEQECSK